MQLTKTVISLLKKNDRKAQFELYRQFYGKMKGISLRYQSDEQAADDIVNRAFLKVLKSIDVYQPNRPFEAWLSRITINENIDACRKNKRIRAIVEYDSEKVSSDANLTNYEYNEAEQNLDADQLIQLINQLPDTTRQVFNLFVIDGYKHQEIAELLKITNGTSKWHLNSARKKIKVMLLKLEETEKVIQYGK
ncbi:MAG: RNA polymerase sigma factor [Saprospiraceae bacterium]|nr:RNA polymerase sigma factor [Saprospiraceae bacterium]